MNSKATPQDLTNADIVGDLTRRCRELRIDLEAAAVREATLREALEAARKEADWQRRHEGWAFSWKIVDQMIAALATPSPAAEAVRAVVEWIEEAERQDAALPAGLWELFNEYRALRDGRADGGAR